MHQNIVSMRYYTTLFDSHYLYRGIALYRSLARVEKDFHIYIFALDDISLQVLRGLNLENATIIPLKDLEDDALLAVKPSRSVAEYCWTLTAPSILYCLENFSLPSCTYLDADLYFFSSPDPIFLELGDASVLITPHNFSPQYKDYALNGIYNVQFMYFRRDHEGLGVLRTWKDQCIDWCYARLEDGKLGDQKYLDLWPEKYTCVHVLEQLELTLGPWNLQQFDLFWEREKLLCSYKESGSKKPVVFFHYHGTKFFQEGFVFMQMYDLSRNAIKYIYEKYIEEVLSIRSYVLENFSVPETGFEISPYSQYELMSIQKKMSKENYKGNNIIVFDEMAFCAMPTGGYWKTLALRPLRFLWNYGKSFLRKFYLRFHA